MQYMMTYIHYNIYTYTEFSVLMSMSGGSGIYKYNAVPGSPLTLLPCDSFASNFQRIDLDRYPLSLIYIQILDCNFKKCICCSIEHVGLSDCQCKLYDRHAMCHSSSM